MVRQMIKSLTMLTLIAVLSLVTAAVSANGQSSRRVVASIPFEFMVGDKQLPAGTYGAEPTTSGSEAIKIVGTSNAKAAIRLSSSLHRNRSDKGKMVFHRYGNQYFLAEIWVAGESDGRQLMKSKGERSVERELASNATPSSQNYQVVEIALVRQ
jgi:hypothetical protein